ncbi:MAG: quinol:cytochrome C oxidoreductase [Bacteroidia bacterium]|nr:quinol:cytochrome C oxidoreductase [Bacteroidia bacterium]
MAHHHIDIKQEKFEFTSKSKIVSIVLLAVGLILSIIGVIQLKNNHTNSNHHQTTEVTTTQTDSHTENTQTHAKSWTLRFWANLLLNSYYFLLFGIGGLFFVALNYIANAGWATLIKRIAEAMSAYIPIGLVLLMIALVFGGSEIYHWVHYEHLHLSEGMEGYDEILAGKSGFLNTKFLYFGVPAILLIWYTVRMILRRLSLREDEEGGLTFFNKSIRISAGFMVFFLFSFSVFAWIVMMSIDAHWYSTIYSVYNWGIMFVTSITVIAFITMYLKSKGYMELVSPEIFHDLGKFMFAFCIFWAYVWTAQFLLIWYANIHEEVVYYNVRLHGYFRPLFFINLFINFFIPFLILMTKNAKRNPKTLLIAGTCILVGHWLDLFVMIMPGTMGESSGIGLLEIGMPIAFAGLFIYVVKYSLSKANLYPEKHPYVVESATYDVGV